MMLRMRRRRGLTLLEVIVAMTIFFISIIAIFQLLHMGTDRAEDVRMRTRTSIRCQAKLAEVVIGAQDITSSADWSNFDSEKDKDLQWKIDSMLYPGNDKQTLYTV